jgi:hypothetical protein
MSSPMDYCLLHNAALHLHRGAEQRDAYHKRTALPGVRCKRLLGAGLGLERQG